MRDSEDRGFRQIGTPIPSNSPLPKIAGLTQRRQPSASATIGSRLPAPTGASAIGERPGATGAVARPNPTQDWERDPRETTAGLVASLPPRIASLLRARYEDRVDLEFGWDGEVAGYDLNSEADKGLCGDALRLIELFVEPLGDQRIVAEIARLRVSCKARAEVEDDMTLAMRVLAEECAEYPADVVMHVLRSWAKREVFTPSLAELRARLQRASRSRQSLMTALSNPSPSRKSA